MSKDVINTRRYDAALQRFPVAPGDVWGAGEHLFMCGDIETQGDAIRERAGRIDYTVVDPPWNAGNATTFRSKAATCGVSHKRVDFERFTASLVELVRHTQYDCFIEFGLQNYRALERAVGEAAGWIVTVIPLTYYRTRPCVLLQARFHVTTSAIPKVVDFSGMNDDVVFRRLIGRMPTGSRIFDPCVGQGLVVEAVIHCGLRCAVNELHPGRLAMTLCKAHALGCGIPERIGRL